MKTTLLIFIVFLGALALFAVSNKETVQMTVPFGAVYEMPKISLILFSAAFGALSMLAVFLVRDTRRLMATYKFQRKLKKEDRIQKLYGKALNAILADDRAEAKTALEEILKIEPEHTDSLLRLGDIMQAEESFEAANGYYRRALSSDEGSLAALFSLARLREAQGRWQDALGYIEEILDIDPDNLSALLRKRRILERDGKWSELIEVQKAALKHKHTEKQQQKEQTALTGYRYELARESLEAGDFDRAGKEFRSVLRMDDRFVPAQLGLAEAMLREGEVDDAVNSLDKAFEETGSLIILARLEDILINAGEPSRLIKIYNNAMARDPKNATLRFFMGKLYYRLEMIEDAFDTLRAIEEPYPELHKLMGELYLRRQQYEKAAEEFKKTVNMKKTLRLPYCCGSCGLVSEEWSGRCPDCLNWNTYLFNIHGTCKV